jgi:hypothetical protein
MLKDSYGSVGTSESSPVIHRRAKNGAPVKVVQSQGAAEKAYGRH